MKRTRLALASALFLLPFMLLAKPVQAVVIYYDAYDLEDVNSGEDLWQYDFTVSGYAFSKDSGFDIFFDSAFYDNLDVGGAPTPDGWLFEVAYSEPHAHAVVSSDETPSLDGVFSVWFRWLGSGDPGSQDFRLFGSDGAVVAWGFTTAAVPEPGTLFLLAMGLLGLAGQMKRGLRSHP